MATASMPERSAEPSAATDDLDGIVKDDFGMFSPLTPDEKVPLGRLLTPTRF